VVNRAAPARYERIRTEMQADTQARSALAVEDVLAVTSQ
jgi:hypothetical protein